MTPPNRTLPEQLTSFVGRGAELAEAEELIAERRLVTLVGVGGCGKTRLAVEVGQRVADRWPDGVRLADLGSLSDPGLLPAVVATAVGVVAEPGGDQLQALAAQLRGRRMLLILDTCEHLLDASAVLAETLLRRCPDVSVLATSREPLGVVGETVWRLAPLRSAEAVQLFGDRAGLVAPRFDAGAVADDVRAVCARVDGVPLAIELAAAWVRALSPAQIAAGLEESLRLLAGAPRGAAARHQTLYASMEWSHGRLSEPERVFFRRLAVFSGTFTLEAARAVAGAADGPDTLALVGQLLDKSLVTARDVDGEIRYRLLDTVRQYAEERLDDAAEADAVRDRHLQHFLVLAEEAERGLEVDQDTWRRRLDGHRANLNAALHWGLAVDDQRGRRLAAALAMQWMIRGQVTEGLEFLRRAIDQEQDDQSLLARLLVGTAMLGMVSGRTDLVAASARRGAELAAAAGDERTRARCLTMAAFPVFFVDFGRCAALAVEARAVAEAAGDPFARDWATVMEGYSLQTRNRHAEAVECARRAFAGSRPRGDRFCAAFARGIEIFCTMVDGDVRAATAVGREVVDLVTPLGDYFAVGTNTCNAAHALVIAGELEEARALMEPVARSLDVESDADVVGFMVPYGLLHLYEGDLDAAVSWWERGARRMSGGRRDWTAARCLPLLAGVLGRLDRPAEARQWADRAAVTAAEFDTPYELTAALDEQARRAPPKRAGDLFGQALAIRRTHGLALGYPDSLDALAALAAEDDPAEAARLLAVADAARARMGCPRPLVDRDAHVTLAAALRHALGEDRYAAIVRDGTAADVESTVAALTRGRGPRDRPPSGWDALTPTEVEVARLIAEGLTNPQIAVRLFMSRSTVKAHLSHIYRKVGVANRTELATLVSAGSATG